MRSIRFLLFMGTLLMLFPDSGSAQENPFKSVLQSFITTALENNPAIKEFQNRIKAAQEVPSQVSSLDDPILQFQLMNMPVDTFDLSQENMTQKLFSLSQKLPYPGKLGLKAEIAGKNIAITEQDLEEARLTITRDVKLAFYELCFVLEATNITKENKTLLEQFVVIAESKYSVGKGLQQDVLKAQVELSKIMERLIELQKLEGFEKAKLNSLMNLLPQEDLMIPHGIGKTDFNFTVEKLQAIAEKHRPLLSKILSLKERYGSSKKLAEKEYYPDFNVGLKYGQRDGTQMIDRPDFVSAFVGINIPIWYKTKQSRRVSETAYKVEMASETYNKAKNQIFLNLKKLVDKEQQGSRTLGLIEQGILPQARQSLESALAGYSVDKVDFLTLLDNQLTLFNWQIKYHRELTDYEKNLAVIEQSAGKNLF
ncbi:MAG: TolC family protein [Nitrospinae bacterium]|nr:TolC family protein [Nitrospinota bacterium]MBL7019200.1 TolC family protein [Nitrospinaceae bacterium]